MYFSRPGPALRFLFFLIFFSGQLSFVNTKEALEHCRFALEVDKTEIMQLSQLRNKGFAILRT